MTNKRKTTSPAARCPVCKKKIAVRRDGTLRVHGYNPFEIDSKPCPGGGVHAHPRRAPAHPSISNGV